MATEDVLSFSELLAQVPGENPAGVDLRTNQAPDSEYRTIRRARDLAGESERRIDRGDLDVESPQWDPVVNLGIVVTATKSKDMDIAAYLIEGLTRVHGFAGVRDGFRLARELVEQFWEHLYPVGEGLDVPDRFSKLIYLNGIEKDGTLIAPIRKVPITPPDSHDCFSLATYLQAQSASMSAPKKGADAVSPLEVFKKAVSEAEDDFYPNLVDDIVLARKEFLGFCEALKQKSGFDPPSSVLVGALQSVLDVVKEVAKAQLTKASDKAASTPQKGEEPKKAEGGEAAVVTRPDVISNRQDALQQLWKVAEYFRANEPQSVIPFALEQVIKWGNMSLPDLLIELIPEEGARKTLFKQVGIKPPGA